MKLLAGNEIRKAILRCNPSKVAVAFIGIDWQTFIPDWSRLDAVIVSPTLGSNPRAISDLAKQVGWEKIYFLDELHAKTYIGEKYAVIGSANLTRNGLSGEDLIELCVESNSAEEINKLNKEFDKLKVLSAKQYPTTESKKKKVAELERLWGAAIANRTIRSNTKSECSFVDFVLLSEDHFYVAWYSEKRDIELSNDIEQIQSKIDDIFYFLPDDKAEKNKWLLSWRITDSFKPHKNETPKWMYIHEVFDDGVIEEGFDYTTCAIQRNDLGVPPHPFELTPDVVAAFRNAIQEPDVAEHLIQKREDIFKLTYSHKGVPLLIERMKKCISNTRAR